MKRTLQICLGGLVCTAILMGIGVATADTVAEILLDGKDTASLAVKTFDNGIATINTDSCEALGLSLDTVKSEIQDLCTQIVETKTEKEFAN